jgi:hypothetical protein
MKWLCVIGLVACSSEPSDGVVGPFTGPVHRYVVDRMTLPVTSDDAHALGDDLDGNGTVDNQLGVVFSALTSTGDGTTHIADMIASGALASSVEIQADSLDSDGSVGVLYYGRDGELANVIGGKIVAGAFTSNRAATSHHTGTATLALPIFDAADPLILATQLVELDFTPDGQGGLDAIVRGAIPIDDARAAATIGVGQMVAADPVRHAVFSRFFDTNHDGLIQPEEIADSSVVGAFLVADLHALDMMSVGFSVHLAPCDSGPCLGAPATDACHDRVRNGTESDVDCGGSCTLKCPAGEACAGAGDCQTAGCDSGACRAASCTDGIRDGIESDADCGAINGCALCAVGKVCVNGMDCASGKCSSSAGVTGVCDP